MPKTKKQLKLDSRRMDTDCDIRLYKDMTLPMIMLLGWFNDQHQCFRLFYQALSSEEEKQLFNTETHLDSVKAKYKQLWDNGTFKENSKQHEGEHKQVGQLDAGGFNYWVVCVFNEVDRFGSLQAVLDSLGSVESAHDRFKPWFARRTKLVRILNTADAARILARYGYLKPEESPLLARGSLRGAAILLNEDPPEKSINTLEAEYQNETKRVTLEKKAAEYIDHCEELSRFGQWKMEEGESWFCEKVHKKWYP